MWQVLTADFKIIFYHLESIFYYLQANVFLRLYRKTHPSVSLKAKEERIRKYGLLENEQNLFIRLIEKQKQAVADLIKTAEETDGDRQMIARLTENLPRLDKSLENARKELASAIQMQKNLREKKVVANPLLNSFWPKFLKAQIRKRVAEKKARIYSDLNRRNFC